MTFEDNPKSVQYCTQCGGQMSHDDRFCRSCGMNVNPGANTGDAGFKKFALTDTVEKEKPEHDLPIEDDPNKLWNSETLFELACASQIGKAIFLEKTSSANLLARFANDPDSSVRAAVGSHVHTPPESLNILATDEDTYVRGAVASNKKTPKNVLKTLAKDNEDFVRWGIAQNPESPIESLKILANDSDESVREQLAGNVKLPVQLAIDVVLSLSEVQDSSTLEELAKNPETAPLLLEALAQSESYEVRWMVASNPNTPSKILEFLSVDEESWVRGAVAANPTTPRKILEALAADDVSEVVKNPNCPLPILLAFANSDESWLRREVAENSTVPVNLLTKLSSDEDSDVRIEVARNPSTPAKLLEELAKDDECDVREAVAENGNSSAAALHSLSQDDEYSVRQEVAANPRALEKTLVGLSEDDEDFVRRSVAGNESTPVRVLEKLALDKEVAVRVAVAGNVNTSAHTLGLLLDDNEREIYCAIADNPRCEPAILESLSTEYGWVLRNALIAREDLPYEALRNIFELLPIYEKVEAKTFKSEKDEAAYANKLLNQYVKTSATKESEKKNASERKKYELVVELIGPEITGDFEGEFETSFDEFASDEEIYELLDRVWISYSLEYGGKKKDKKFRDSSPLGDFSEGELVDGVDGGYRTDLVLNHQTGEFHFRMAKTITFEVEAFSEEEAKQHVIASAPRCFSILDDECPEYLAPIEIVTITSIRVIEL